MPRRNPSDYMTKREIWAHKRDLPEKNKIKFLRRKESERTGLISQ